MIAENLFLAERFNYPSGIEKLSVFVVSNNINIENIY